MDTNAINDNASSYRATESQPSESNYPTIKSIEEEFLTAEGDKMSFVQRPDPEKEKEPFLRIIVRRSKEISVLQAVPLKNGVTAEFGTGRVKVEKVNGTALWFELTEYGYQVIEG